MAKRPTHDKKRRTFKHSNKPAALNDDAAQLADTALLAVHELARLTAALADIALVAVHTLASLAAAGKK